jgi:hypothetical protein
VRLLFVAYELTMQHERHRFKVFEAHPNGGDSVSLRHGSWRWGRGTRQQKIKCTTVWSNIDSKRVRVSITGICHLFPPLIQLSVPTIVSATASIPPNGTPRQPKGKTQKPPCQQLSDARAYEPTRPQSAKFGSACCQTRGLTAGSSVFLAHKDNAVYYGAEAMNVYIERLTCK